ncbi:MAG: hypothetical protein ABSH28_13390 [Acidobacteriota bacterium]
MKNPRRKRASTSLDDIFLTHWPAHTLVTHAQILNCNGQYIEQSSSLFPPILSLLAGSLSLMSHQDGMINFYVARSYFRRVQFVDLAGPFSRHISCCPEAIDIGRFQTPFISGTIIPWDFYFSHKKEVQSCGIPEPDIIFDLYFDNGIFPCWRKTAMRW